MAAWRAAGRMAYPNGPFIQLLMLHGGRRDMLADAQWSEIDLDNRVWRLSTERMKTAAPFVLPLPDAAGCNPSAV